MRLISYQSHDHAVEVEEEHDEVEAELDERFLHGISSGYNFLRMGLDQSNLLVHIEFPEYFRCVQKMLVLKDSVVQVSPALNACQRHRSLLRIVCE